MTECDIVHADLEGQGSGTGDTGQDVGSPAKKLRTGSGAARARDAGNLHAGLIFSACVRVCMHRLLVLYGPFAKGV